MPNKTCPIEETSDNTAKFQLLFESLPAEEQLKFIEEQGLMPFLINEAVKRGMTLDDIINPIVNYPIELEGYPDVYKDHVVIKEGLDKFKEKIMALSMEERKKYFDYWTDRIADIIGDSVGENEMDMTLDGIRHIAGLCGIIEEDDNEEEDE